MLRGFILAIALVLLGCVSVQPPPCTLPESDSAWLDRALEAWRFTSREITGIGPVADFEAVIFSEDCVLTSASALSSVEGVSWTAQPHAGTIALPDGSEMPAGVTSFVSGDEGSRYLAMSTPSVWEAAGVGEGIRLETMMIAVLLHEGSHVAQVGPYGSRLEALIDRYNLPESFNDNAVQDRFGEDEEFAAFVEEETRLFLAAAAAEDGAAAVALARQARLIMIERQERWFVGDDRYLAEAEDIWLTFEGAGQWTGYQWLIHPQSSSRAVSTSPQAVHERASLVADRGVRPVHGARPHRGSGVEEAGFRRRRADGTRDARRGALVAYASRCSNPADMLATPRA